MRPWIQIAFVASLAIVLFPGPLAAQGSAAPREKLLLDFGWRFHLGDAADPARDFDFGRGASYAKAGDWGGAVQPGFDDSAWRSVDLPHDWVVEQEFVPGGDEDHKPHGFRPVGRNYPASAIGWYRRSFEIPREDAGRRMTVEFDGVYRDCWVWLNGHLLGRNESGYSSFALDITDYANYGGRNVLVVRCDASQYEGWFYEGAGIYRHVWLTKTAPLHVAQWGTYITTEVGDAAATVTVRTRILNAADQVATNCGFELRLLDATDAEIAKLAVERSEFEGWKEHEQVAKIKFANPHLWSLTDPYLYKLVTSLRQDGKTVDRVETSLGVRTIHFDADQGFFLNGQRVEIKGVCCHQDHAGVGSALPDRLQSFRIEKLKEMGCNAYRTSHNAPTPELLDACDRLGMLVMDEHRLIGSSPEILGQLERMILRDRNHPSIILWSLGNEESEAVTTRGARIGASMLRTVKRLDPTRPATYASNQGNNDTGLNQLVDVRGVNYLVLGDIDKYHQAHRRQPMFGSEEASTVSTRGIYTNDKEHGYLSAYDVNKPNWGALAEQWWTYYAARPHLAGAFVWTGFDYRGEPTPYGWPCISSHFGIMDTCGFPKDNYYYYQSWWSDRPVLHILPHWSWPGREGQEIDVWVHSNLERVELLLNGRSLGMKEMPRNSHLSWKVAYEPGTLEARGTAGDAVALTARVETTGPAAKLTLSPDRAEIAADGEDVSIVTVAVEDALGRRVPTAGNQVRFKLEGPGRIIGVGNGDPSCHEPDTYFAVPQARAIRDWKFKQIDAAENRPETGEAFDDSTWDSATIDATDAHGMAPNSFAVYRTIIEVNQTEVAGAPLTLQIGQIDDHGWIYVNGQMVAETHDWRISHAVNLSDKLRPGRNTIAIIVKNEAGRGGIGRGINLVQPGPPPAWQRSLFNGLAQVFVQSRPSAGEITLTAEGDGLAPARTAIRGSAITLRPAVP